MSEPVEVWFDPACSKCRIAREQLDEAVNRHRWTQLGVAAGRLGLAAVQGSAEAAFRAQLGDERLPGAARIVGRPSFGARP